MNKNNIIEWIDNPVSVDEDATRELRDIIQEFPASPILHWLYLKGLQNQKSYLFNSALSRAAIGSPNRSQLLSWVGIEQPATEDAKKQRFEFVIPEIEKGPEEETKVEEKVAPVVTEDKKEKPIRVAPKSQPLRPKKKAPADLPDDIKALLEKSKRIRADYNEAYSTEAEETEEEPVHSISDNVEIRTEEPVSVEPVIEQPIPSIEELTEKSPIHNDQEEVFPEPLEISIQQMPEEQTEEMSFTIDEPVAEEETYFSIDLDLGIAEESKQQGSILEPVEVENSFSIELEDYSEEVIPETEESKTEEIRESGDADFASWLKTLKSDEAGEPEIYEPEPVATKEEITFRLETDVVPQEPKKVDPVKEKKIELIDKFLEERPKITPRKEDFSLLNIADNLEGDDNQFVTETLAKVYLAQGHTNRAIEAYEILGLKYPEKNSFFADRIREIKRRK